MAPHLLGPHYSVTCSNCRAQHEIAWTPETDLEFVCSQCGTLQPRDPQLKPKLGDQVPLQSVVSDAQSFWTPRRFDVVVVVNGDDRSTSTETTDGRLREAGVIKRVIGLPGELLQFRYGDLYVDGRLVQKKWQDQVEQSVVVHRDDWAGSVDSILGWKPEGGGGWRRQNEGWIHQSPVEAAVGRLVYHHRRCVLTQQGFIPEAPIEDTLVYSQSRARKLNPVSDLMVTGRIKLTPKSRLSCALKAGSETVHVEWDYGRSIVRVRVPGRPQSVSAAVAWPSHKDLKIAFSCFDRKVTLVHEDRVVLEVDFSQVAYTSHRQGYSSQPVSFEAQGEVELKELSILRDLHLVGPYGDETNWDLGRRLESDEFFLVGDHLADSIDSRTSGRGWRRSEMLAWVPRD